MVASNKKQDTHRVHKFEKGFLSYDNKATKVGYSIDHRPFSSPVIIRVNKRSVLVTDNKGTVHQIFVIEEERVEFSESGRYMYHLLFNQIEQLYKFIEHLIESCSFFIKK